MVVPSRLAALKAHLDVLAQRTEIVEDVPPDQRALLERVVADFLAAGPDVLEQAIDHLWAYYRDVVSDLDADERREQGVPGLEPSDDIWRHVQIELPPTVALGGTPLEPDPSYLSFEGEVSWEPEHGLQLVLAGGSRICKVGPYDGHHTQAHAYGDASLLGVVYR